MSQTTSDNRWQSTDPDSATNRPRRLWRWLMAGLVVVMVVPAAIIGYRYQHQMALIERLTSGTGSIVTVPRGPTWLRSVVEADRLRGIDDIIIVNNLTQPTTEELKQLARQPLRELQLLDADLSGEGACYLGQMEELMVLEFGARSRVTEEMLNEIAGLPNLTTIRIRNKMGMPPGADEIDWILHYHLGELDSVVPSRFDETFISGSLSPLRQMPQLREVTIHHRMLTADNLAEIGELKQLESLSLIDCGIDNGGLRHLAALPKLKVLSFEHSNLTDQSLETLHGHPMIKRLDISFSLVSAQGEARLRENLPDCTVLSGIRESTLHVVK